MITGLILAAYFVWCIVGACKYRGERRGKRG